MKAPSLKEAEERSLFAVCVDGGDSTAHLDASFLRSRFFAIYRGDGTLENVHPNPAAEQPGGTAIKAVNYLTRRGVRSVVAAQFDNRALELLNFVGVEPLGAERGLPLHRVTAMFLQGLLKQW